MSYKYNFIIYVYNTILLFMFIIQFYYLYINNKIDIVYYITICILTY